jgi:ubiquinone/menaquinone biosynthesis C-methylase UbiE
MKQVKPNVYNRDFYSRVYNDEKEFERLDFAAIHDYYREIANLADINQESKIVDFGCGNGNLAFYLAISKSCSVVGIDYSQDAIDICNERLRKLKQKNVISSKIEFINLNNYQLPKISSVNTIFVCDVFEHMYDKEIGLVLKKFKTWKKNKKITVVIHTDNNYYLNFIRPFLDIVGMVLGHQKLQDIKNRNTEENKVHVNLTNIHKLNKIMGSFGFKQRSVTYPEVTMDKVKKQLGALSKFPLICNTVYFSLSKLNFLSPSFYAVYEL